MPKAEQPIVWVVYRMTVNSKKHAFNAVCEQAEWDAMELARPGYHQLLHAGVTSEAEAERLARGVPDPVSAGVGRKSRWA